MNEFRAGLRRLRIATGSRHSDAKAHDVRGDLRDDDEAVYLMDHPDSDEEIPTLDIAAYLTGQPGGREAAAAQAARGQHNGRLLLPQGSRHPAGA